MPFLKTGGWGRVPIALATGSTSGETGFVLPRLRPWHADEAAPSVRWAVRAESDCLTPLPEDEAAFASRPIIRINDPVLRQRLATECPVTAWWFSGQGPYHNFRTLSPIHKIPRFININLFANKYRDYRIYRYLSSFGPGDRPGYGLRPQQSCRQSVHRR